MKSLFSLMLAMCMLFSLLGTHAETVDAETTVSAPCDDGGGSAVRDPSHR
jgi:hypothetical protein